MRSSTSRPLSRGVKPSKTPSHWGTTVLAFCRSRFVSRSMLKILPRARRDFAQQEQFPLLAELGEGELVGGGADAMGLAGGGFDQINGAVLGGPAGAGQDQEIFAVLGHSEAAARGAGQIFAEDIGIVLGVFAERVKKDELRRRIWLVVGRIARVVDAGAVGFPGDVAPQRTFDVGDDIGQFLAAGDVKQVEGADVLAFGRQGGGDRF